MKKFITTLLFLTPLISLANEFDVNAPQWKNFAPKTFVDVQEPKLFKRLNVTAKYWYERRLAFEEGLAECKALTSHEERFSCYEILKIKQYKENTDYNAKIEARQQANSNIQEMNGINNNMVPINNFMNNYTHFMPNELR